MYDYFHLKNLGRDQGSSNNVNLLNTKNKYLTKKYKAELFKLQT